MLFTEDHLETDPEVSAGIEHGTLRIASMRADHAVTYPPCILLSKFVVHGVFNQCFHSKIVCSSREVETKCC